jgi:hypothetical protein
MGNLQTFRSQGRLSYLVITLLSWSLLAATVVDHVSSLELDRITLCVSVSCPMKNSMTFHKFGDKPS